jgi:hypothetical protein
MPRLYPRARTLLLGIFGAPSATVNQATDLKNRRTREDDALAVGRPVGKGIFALVVREPNQVGAVNVHDVDLAVELTLVRAADPAVAVASAGEGDRRTVGRERRGARVSLQKPQMRVDADAPKRPFDSAPAERKAREHEGMAVRRPGRLEYVSRIRAADPVPEDRFLVAAIERDQDDRADQPTAPLGKTGDRETLAVRRPARTEVVDLVVGRGQRPGIALVHLHHHRSVLEVSVGGWAGPNECDRTSVRRPDGGGVAIVPRL